jgi:hypothetical protein
MKLCVSLSEVSHGYWTHGAGNTSSNARQGILDLSAFWKRKDEELNVFFNIHTGQEQFITKITKSHMDRTVFPHRSII